MEDSDFSFVHMRNADIQGNVSIKQLNMQGWTQEVWTADINLGVSAGRNCEVRVRWHPKREED